jgi:hypothetical protein
MPICRPPLGEPELMLSCCSPFCLLGELGEHGLMPICCSSNGLTISRIILSLVRLFSKRVLIKHFTYFFTFFAFTSIVVLCLTNFFLLFFHFSAAGSGNEAVAEEERRHQTAAVESAIRGQPGLLSAAKSATLGASVLADMDAFFREFDRMSFSSRHAEHFWTFDDVKADFEIFRVPQGGIRFLKAL